MNKKMNTIEKGYKKKLIAKYKDDVIQRKFELSIHDNLNFGKTKY